MLRCVIKVFPEDHQLLIVSYACSLSLSSTQSGHYGPFFRLQVPVPQETPFPPRIDSAQPQVFPEAPTVGSTVYLECFAYGNPVPIYKWSRVDGRRVNKKAVFMHHGRVLRIDHAEVSDNGRYKCSAGNSLGVAAGEVTLLLRTPPTIMLPLADRLVPTESVFTLECPLSTMDMHSSVEWFKDAKPIVPLLMPSHQRKRFNVNQNILTVNSTTTGDSGVYQCVVSSEVGVASSSAYVLVRDSPPVFPRQAMPKKLFAVNGSSVSIPCFYYASPRGHSRWADAGGAKLPHKGRVRDHHGVLHIENVLHDDAGYFFCSAHNRLGKAHAQMELVVVDKAQVQVDSDGSLSPEETVNISCSVAVDCGKSSDCPEAFFKWTFDNRSLDSLSGMHVKTKVSPGKATRPNKVACFSLYGEDSLDLSPKPQIPAPLALKVEQEQQAVRLAWRKPSTHRDIRNHAVSGEVTDDIQRFLKTYGTCKVLLGTVIVPYVELQADSSGGYLVELRTKDDRQWRPAPREVIAETESQSVVLDSLIPNTLYQFRIRTVDSTSMGDPSTPTSWIRTPPAAPVEAVESLRWRALDNSTIFVEWDPVETVADLIHPRNALLTFFLFKIHHAGDHLRYRLSWSMEDSASVEAVTAGKRTFHSHHLETKNPQAIVRMNATDDCRMLVFSVRPVNDQGAGLTSTDTVAFMNSKGEPRQVFFKNATALNSTHASFSWEWDKVNECGRTRAVQIFVYVSETASEAVVLTMPINRLSNPERPSARLDGLRLMYMYTIQVAGYNSGGLGPLSSPRIIRLGPQSTLDEPSSARCFPFILPILWCLLIQISWSS
ncbi:immunoglobulin domain protein [Ancylostoma ceylanicum]|uniref:Immunoglobulin domain protein n=1 Tax=Ancylostoma ceylanicum TaxID=53326 RepID=A0A0D6LTX3_9BILA|nr:immunoglobulin domain protein [Ancylostoma ceylanicum]